MPPSVATKLFDVMARSVYGLTIWLELLIGYAPFDLLLLWLWLRMRVAALLPNTDLVGLAAAICTASGSLMALEAGEISWSYARKVR